MVNCFGFAPIKTQNLPKSWQEYGILKELGNFLQSNWEQRFIFYSDGHVTSRQQFVDFDKCNGIKVQNYVGTIVFKEEQLNIFLKVFKEDEDDNNTEQLDINNLVHNLIIWLGYCDKLNFPFVFVKEQLHISWEQ